MNLMRIKGLIMLSYSSEV